jgi:hypothetical protein
VSARNIHDRVAEALVKLGASVVKRNPKTTVYTVPGYEKNFYLGRSHSLRYGSTAELSIPVDRVKARLLASVPV